MIAFFFFFFFNDTATTEIYTLSLHDALPILSGGVSMSRSSSGPGSSPFSARTQVRLSHCHEEDRQNPASHGRRGPSAARPSVDVRRRSHPGRRPSRRALGADVRATEGSGVLRPG